MSRRSRFSILIPIILLAAALRLFHLGTPRFWGDEMISFSLQDLSIRQLLTYSPDRHVSCYIEPPGYHILNMPARALVPSDEDGFQLELSRFAQRLLPAIAGVLSVWMMYILARRFLPAEGAWIPSALLSFSFYAIYYSQENRAYIMVVLMTLVSTWLFLEAFFGGRRRLAWFYGPSIAALGYLHYLALMVPLVHLAAFLVSWFFRASVLRRKEWLRPTSADALAFGLAGLMALALYAPWLRHALVLGLDPTSVLPTAYKPQSGPPYLQMWKFFSLATHFGCGTLGACFTYVPLFLLGFARTMRGRLENGALVACFLLVPGAYMIFAPYSMYVVMRYLIFLFPIYHLMAGVGLITLAQWCGRRFEGESETQLRRKRVSTAVVWSVLAILLAQNLAGLVPYYLHHEKCSGSVSADPGYCRAYILSLGPLEK